MKPSTRELIAVSIMMLMFGLGCKAGPIDMVRISDEFTIEQQEDIVEAARAWIDADPCVPDLPIRITDADSANVVVGTPSKASAISMYDCGIVTLDPGRIRRDRSNFRYIAMHEIGHAINPGNGHIGEGNVMYLQSQDDITEPTEADVDWICNL